jgi:outer membrane protein assembly factor BamB
VRFSRVAWRWRPAEPSWIASSPVVHGDRVYIGAVHQSAFRPTGAIYCLDRATGESVWSFNNGGKMKDVFSSPQVADGRVYVGEGFHQHVNCRLYCLDAADGKLLWQFETGSHTESTPWIVDGKVYFGAGDDGLYCLDAATGKEVWHLHQLHVDANPIVADGKLYCGSGKGDVYQTYCVFCCDAATGNELWRMPTPHPVWGGCTLVGGNLYVGFGNGNFLDSDTNPAGGVLCLDPRTGERRWQFDARDGVHGRILADAAHVWLISRDQHCYCLNPKDGRKRWETDLGTPVVASPALARCTCCGAPVSLYVIASGGEVAALDPDTGERQWSFDVSKDNGGQDTALFSSPTAIVSRDAHGDRRQVYFGSGLNGQKRGVLYCLEDQVKQPGAE